MKNAKRTGWCMCLLGVLVFSSFFVVFVACMYIACCVQPVCVLHWVGMAAERQLETLLAFVCVFVCVNVCVCCQHITEE